MAKWLKSTEQIEFSVKDRIARITLNRPEKRNAVSPQMRMELEAALLEADDLLDVNVIVLQGAGKDFCAGGDLTALYAGLSEEARRLAEQEAAKYRSTAGTLDDDCWQMERAQQKVTLMFDLHKPVIAKVQGNCLAVGTDIALACDMVVVADDAKIGFPATRANGTPMCHMWYYNLGPQWAKRMLMTGDVLLGKDAARLGLVLDSAPRDELDATVDELARRISCVDAEMLSTHKRVVNLAMELEGVRAMQRLSAELDAKSHLSKGPRRTQFKKDMAESGLKVALKNRDEPFGDGIVKFGGAKA